MVFTNVGQTTIAADVVTSIRTAIIGIIEAISHADCTMIAPIINSLIISSINGNMAHCSLFHTPVTVRNALVAAIGANQSSVVVVLITVSLFIDCNYFNIMDFDGVSITKPVQHININAAPDVVGATAGVVPPNPIAVATNAALVVNQAAATTTMALAATALATTLPTVFNINSLPPAIILWILFSS